MSDYEKGIITRGVVTGIKLNVEKEKSNGSGSFRANIFQFETDDGDKVKHMVPTKSPSGKYIEKLKVGDKVAVKTGGKYNSVLAVFVGDKKEGGYSGNKEGGFKKKEYDPTGPIQGMVLASAVQVAINEKPTDADLHDVIIEAAKEILKAKSTVDQLVVEALSKNSKSSKKEDDSDEDDFESDSDRSPSKDEASDDDFDEEPIRKSKKSPY